MESEINLEKIPVIGELRRRILADVKDLDVHRTVLHNRIRWDVTVQLRPEGRGGKDPGRWVRYQWSDSVTSAHPEPQLELAIRLIDHLEAEFRKGHPGIRNVIPMRWYRPDDERFHLAVRRHRKIKAARASRKHAQAPA